MKSKKTLSEIIDSLDQSMQVILNPPQEFIVIKTINAIELGDDGQVESIFADSKQTLYLLTDDLRELLSQKTPEVTLS